jgi:cytohesin
VAEVKRLLKSGAEVDARNNSGWTPLHFAAQSQDENTIRALLAAGADVDARDDETSGTPLIFAADCGIDEGCIKALLEVGADVNARDRGGQTALHLAAYMGNAAGVKALLEAGAEVNAQDNKHNWTPLHCLAQSQLQSAKKGAADCVELLASAGADLLAKCAEGRSPYEYAFFKECREAIKKAVEDKMSLDSLPSE